MVSNPKPVKYKNEKYLKTHRYKERCVVCGSGAEPHHCNGILNQNAMGSKNDYLIIDLCRKHHEEAHKFPKMFGITNNIDIKNIIIQNLINYIEEQR